MTDHYHIGSLGDQMPTITVEQEILSNLVAACGQQHQIETLENELPLIGCDIDSCDENTLEVEIFPDRPDMLSAETLAHTMIPFLHKAEPNPELDVVTGTIKMAVEDKISEIRPVILAAVVRSVNIDESAIKRLMDHQEKLHFSLGRRRKRASIGVHDLAKISPPFTVKAVDRSHSFTPLASSKEMTIDEILAEHAKGQEYAHLLEGMELVPVIVDSEDNVLSFPPIINGDHTTVTNQTKDVLIDVTGWDQRSCEVSLLLICLQLQHMGGQVEAVEIQTAGAPTWSIDGSPIQHKIQREEVESLLGRKFTDEQILEAVRRMGGLCSVDGETITMTLPRWRYDILHPVDLIEEIAIGHGYDGLGEDFARTSLSGTPREDGQLRRRINSVMQGMGLMQIQSLTLSSEEDQFEKMRWQENGNITRIANPITTEHTILRQNILPGLLRLLSANRHHDLPQAIYELGTVVIDHANHTRLAFAVAQRDGGFATLRGKIQVLMRDLGCKEWSLRSMSEGPWLGGRGAEILIGQTVIGQCGEIDPHVGESFELKVPITAAEISVSALKRVLVDPVH
jgi:phenylalanyl-tRNA synthetase beta chain